MKHIITFALSVFAMAAIARPVNSMLGADGIEIIYDNNSPLPDGVVPIEYIESTGADGSGQFIDTGLLIDARTDVIFCRCAFTKFTRYGTILGVNGNARLTARINNQSQEWEFQGPTGLTGTPIVLYDIYEFQIASNANGGSFLNDIVGSFNPSSSYIFTRSLYLFAVHDYRGYWNLNAGYRSSMRLYEFRIIRNEEVLCDMIPVRVENEGFLYDTISGELFFNMGTGEFIIGPDLED